MGDIRSEYGLFGTILESHIYMPYKKKAIRLTMLPHHVLVHPLLTISIFNGNMFINLVDGLPC